CSCAAIYGNMNQNNTTLASSVSFQAKVCLTGPLAIKLLSFNAQLKDNDVLLFWKLSQPEDKGVYEVQRSTDGTNFSSIKKMILTK
ncbi:MAG: hypothetical protein ABI550_07880, partial [Ignavibacteriaceae bacterium]